MKPSLVDEVRAALVAVRAHRGKKIVRVAGRSCSRPHQVEQAALLEGMTAEDFALIENEMQGSEAKPAPAKSPSEGFQDHETIPTLSPGSALFVPDGRLAALGEGAKWCLPGDFALYLEAGEDDNSGRVRELLVGPFREFDDPGDHDRTPGNFLTDPEWDYVVGGARTEVMHLVQEIGFNPLEERPEDSKPRGESWLAERAAADAKAAELESRVAELTSRLAELTTENAELSEQVSATGLPEDAIERLVALKGVSEKLAGEILEALKP